MQPGCVAHFETPNVVQRGTVPVQLPEKKQPNCCWQVVAVVWAEQRRVVVPVQEVPLQVQPVRAWQPAMVEA